MRINPAYEAEYGRLRAAICDLSTGDSELVQRRIALLDKNRDVYYAKDSDYSSNGLPFGNVRASSECGVSPWRGVLLRMMDKRNRVDSFISKGSYRVADEAVMDTLLDLQNYAIFGVALFAEDPEGVDDPHETEKVRESLRSIGALAVCAAEIHQRTGSLEDWADPWETMKSNFAQLCSIARGCGRGMAREGTTDTDHVNPSSGMVKYG
jgi:hypothetical protein